MNGDLWVVKKDVPDILGFRDSYIGLRSVDSEDRDTHKMHTLGGEQNVTIINESGLYTLILRSNKPESKAFKRWVPA